MSSVQVFLCHSGERLSLDPNAVSTLDALKAFLAKHGIPARNQILLTAQGKQVRTQTLLTDNELFVFDSSRFSAKGVTSPSSSSLASSGGNDFNPGTPPEGPSNKDDLQAYQSLFRLRKSWASGLLNGCESRARLAEKYQDEQLVIERGLGVAVASLQQHIKSAEQKVAAAESWAHEALQEQEAPVSDWQANLDSLKNIPARPEFTRFIQPPNAGSKRLSQQGSIASLEAFVDVASVKKAASGAKSATSSFSQKVAKMRESLSKASAEGEELLRAVDQINTNSVASNNSEPAQLLEEIEVVFRKLSSDFDHIQTLPRTPQSVSQAAKISLLHTRNFIPNLEEYCNEMNAAVHRTRQLRQNASETASDHMATLSSIESVLAQLYQDIKTLEIPQDDQQEFATLSIVSRLPSVYGALLVESVRRREWVSKMKRDAGTLQEEVATYQDEEDKRRKKWVRTVEDVCKPEALRSSVLGIELNLQNEGGSWPMVTREELSEYLNTLTEVYGQCAVTEEMDQAIKDLDKPTRKQIKHAKAFKNGSMHEAAFGDTSLMLRGDEQHKALREMNTRLEEDLKGQKSRVRKLEDLLHRQSNIGRVGTGDMFTPQSSSAGADRNVSSPGAMPRPPSDDVSTLSHQRKSSVQVMEEKKLARRVVDLEAELQAAKDEATSRKNSDAEVQKQVEEAMSTKKDLMENMEAQQREFATERRNLEKELTEAKERVEEVENELERLMGSRDDERNGADAKVVAFEQEVARLKEDAQGHAARAANEQHVRTSTERKLEIVENAKAEAEAQLRKMESEHEHQQDAEAEHMQHLSSAHAHLSPETEAPQSLSSLALALEELTRRSVAHAHDLEDALALARSENKSLWSSNEKQKDELATAAKKQSEVEDAARQTQERLGLEEAKSSSLQQQLGQEQEQLRTLRDKFADGETGSEVLRQQVANEEARAGKLSARLAEANSHINSLDVELMRLQKNHDAFQETSETLAERLEKRAEHAKEISRKLYAQNTRLSRLLERFGFAISYQDDVMVLERASKMASSTTMIDPRSHLNRTVSLDSPPPTRKSSSTEEPSDLSALRWPDAQSVEQENAQFEAFKEQISRFNIDTFSEAIIKRVRDFEYTARKYNKEAKDAVRRADAYKERSLKLKSEAHMKIAVKDFKEGDLALFLPTRGQAKGAWAAFNIGCPHHFLAEKEGMRLTNRDFIVARINKVEQKVVDLSKTMPPQPDGRSIDEMSEAPSVDDDNPFDLSDGLTWWMVHATEERGAGGAPTTPGLGRSTVASANVDAKGSIRVTRNSKNEDASKHLNKLDSRRSSSTSKKGVPGASAPSPTVATNADAVAVAAQQRPESQTSLRPLPSASQGANTGLGIITDNGDAAAQPQNEQVRKASDATRPDSRAASPGQARRRSKSPSKSVRSLQRHLEPHSPAKSPARAAAKKQGWESLWQGEFTLESPSKPSR